MSDKHRESAPALPNVHEREVGGRGIDEIIKAGFLARSDDEYKSLAKLLSSNQWVHKASEILLSLHMKRNGMDKDGTARNPNIQITYNDYEAFLIECYAPLNSMASVGKLAEDIKKFHDEERRREYFTEAEVGKEAE